MLETNLLFVCLLSLQGQLVAKGEFIRGREELALASEDVKRKPDDQCTAGIELYVQLLRSDQSICQQPR